MKGVFVILDGVGDQPSQSLGQITPLQAAKTPYLNKIAKHSKMDYCHTVKKDFVPESSEAVVSLLGYDHTLYPRGPLEALGLGIKLKAGDIAFRCNFATINDLEHGEILDRRAGRTLTTKEARILSDVINKGVKLKYKFEFHPSVQHRGVLVIRGGFSDNISEVDVGKNGKLQFAKPLDEDENSQLAAELVNSFVRQSHRILDNHPINKARAKKGLFSANVILCRGGGNEPPRFKKMKGRWMALGYMPLEIGIARATGMEVYKIKYPKLKGLDVYANLNAGLYKGIKGAIKMLRWNWKKFDYFYIHLKETDLAGHDNKPHEKVKMIEMIDKYFFSFLGKFIAKKKSRLVLTADHATPCRLKGHSSDPVPVLTYPHPKGKMDDKRFTEVEGLEGRRILGKKLLEENFYVKKGK